MDLTTQMEQDAAAAEAHATMLIAVEKAAQEFMAAGVTETPAYGMARVFYGTEYA